MATNETLYSGSIFGLKTERLEPFLVCDKNCDTF